MEYLAFFELRSGFFYEMYINLEYRIYINMELFFLVFLRQ